GRNSKEESVPPQIAAELEPVIRKRIKDGKRVAAAGPQAKVELGPEINRAIEAAIERFGFWDYLDWKATEGAPLALPKVRKDIRLGHTGSYILWAIEALVAGGIAAGFMGLRSQRPFCTNCTVWKQERELGRLDLAPERAAAVFTSGALAELASE